MTYNKKEHTKNGVIRTPYTVSELRELSKTGDRRAIKELVDLKGGPDALTNAQKWRVTKLLLGYGVEL